MHPTQAHTPPEVQLAPAAALARTGEPHWLDRSLFPFAPHYLETPEGRMHYVDEGRGAPILMVHGTPSWSFEWREQIRQLRSEYRCIAPDHLGFGLSDKPAAAAYRPADHARRLLGLIEHLDLRDVTLVVHDFGGPIGLWAALERPERVRAIVVLNSWMWGMADDAQVRRISRFVASPLGRFLYLWLNGSPRWLLPASFADKRKLSPEARAHYLGPFTHRQERVAPWVLGCELHGSASFFDELWARREALPVTPSFVWGMSDPAVGPDVLRRFFEQWPAAPSTELPGVGHFPQEEAPERVSAAIRAAASLQVG